MPNIFLNLPEDLGEEHFQTLRETQGFKLERIVSNGQATPEGKWLDQDRDEWVILLKGSAGLLMEDEPKERVMNPGDYLHIPAHQRHRVEWTSAETETVWLAVHFTQNT